MSHRLKSCFLATMLVVSIFSPANQTHAADNMTNPPGLNWKVIHTDNFDIIFSDEIADDAQRVANLAEYYSTYLYKTMDGPRRHIPLVLINHTTDSNGFVSPMPWMSHWYSVPSSFGGQEWYESLAVHEGRHMAQFSTLRTNSKEFLWYMFGDMGPAFFNMLMVPTWAFEGDAVLTETLLTEGGRGRIPSFDMWVRAAELARTPDDRYSYYRAYMGSYNDDYPVSNHYVLGYHMITNARRRFGAMFWSKVFRGVAEDWFFTFDATMADNNPYETDITDLYDDTYTELRGLWLEQQAALSLTPARILSSTEHSRWTGYLTPFEFDGTLVALKTGKDELAGIVNITPGENEEMLTRVPLSLPLYSAMQNERNFTAGGTLMAWTETRPDLRWGYRSYSDIVIYDKKSQSTRRLPSDGRIINAALSTDGSLLAGARFDEKRRASIQLLDPLNGEILRTIPVAGNDYVYDLAISPDKTRLVCSTLNTEGNALLSYNLASGERSVLTEYTHDEQPKSSVFWRNYIIYQSDYSGIDNIYALDLENGERFQITSRPFGCFFPSVSADGNRLFFSDYSARGYSVSEMDLDPAEWTPLEEVARAKINYFEPILDQEYGTAIGGNNVPDILHPVENYYPSLHALNVHSWMPVVDLYNKDYGLSFISNDVLNTMAASLTWLYNSNEHANSAQADIVWSGWYPVLTLSGITGDRVKANPDEDAPDEYKYISWHENTGQGMITLPFDLSRGIHSLNLELSTGGAASKINDKSLFENNANLINDGTLYTVFAKASLVWTAEGTLLDIYPRWGAALMASHYRTPDAGDYTAEQTSYSGKIWLPSPLPHHGFMFEANWERNRPELYQYESLFLFPRGYESEFNEDLFKFSANYGLPLLNTALPIWKVIYIKRFKTNLFYDHGLGRGEHENKLYRSAGAELIVEWNALSNKYFALNSAVRYSRCIDTKENKYEFVLMMQ